MEVRTRGVADRAHQIEDGANSQLPSERRKLLERGMIRRRENVAASRHLQASFQPIRIAIDLHAHRLEHVGGADRAADRPIAVLGDRHARRRGNQRSAGRDVEGTGAIATGAAGVEHVAVAKIEWTRAREHCTHRACQLVSLGALDFQRHQERADDGVVRAAVHDLADREFGLGAGERAPADERLQRVVKSAHRAFPSRSSRSRKFFSRCLPSKVRIDSG